jgi:ubiquinone/menaquinone biosynthesis C-methylase UbiE
MMNLENDGERMDIDYFNMNYEIFDIYQKSHYKRYEFAQTKVNSSDLVADMACGSGYGTMMLSNKCSKIDGYDIDEMTISEINKRYADGDSVEFIQSDLLNINIENKYDKIVSFETIEHFTPDQIMSLLSIFYNALKENGKLIFSTPYNQDRNVYSMKYHKSFYITEEYVMQLFKDKFEIEQFYYQDYDSHNIKSEDDGNKHFLIGIAKKI